MTCKSDCVLLTVQNVVRITTLEIYLYDNYVMFFQIGPKQTSPLPPVSLLFTSKHFHCLFQFIVKYFVLNYVHKLTCDH